MNKILNRFIDIWKLDFLTKFLAGEKNDNKTTIGFWIVSNFLIVMLFVGSFMFSLMSIPGELVDYIEKNIPDNARITVTDGQLITENIDEPFFREIDANNEGISYDKKIAIIIDTYSETYDITSLDEYESGVIVLGDRIYTKNNTELNHVLLADVPNFSFSKEDLVVFIDKYFSFIFITFLTVFIGGFIFLYLAVFRLLSAFWWALMLFAIMQIFDVKESYMTAYKAVLNFYFIPMIVVFALGIIGLHVPFVTTLIFIAVFIANLIWLKRQRETKPVQNVLESVDKKANTPTITQIKK